MTTSNPPPAPSYLSKRLNAAKQGAEAARDKRRNPAPAQTTQPPQPIEAAPPKHAPAAQKRRSEPAPRPAETADQNGADLARDVQPANPGVAADVASDAALIEALRRRTTEPDLFAWAEPHLPAVFAALLASARVEGQRGTPDRSKLFRMLGLPWEGAGAGKGSTTTVIVQQRLSRAVSRIEASRRHGGVTVTVASPRDRQSAAAPDEGAHVLPEHVRSAPATIEGAIEPDE